MKFRINYLRIEISNLKNENLLLSNKQLIEFEE